MIVGGNSKNPVNIGSKKLTIISGPCAIESLEHSLYLAEELKLICKRQGVQFIFKACYDKDCRSSADSFHGVGLKSGIRILQEVKSKIGVPVVSDFSVPNEANEIAQGVDLLQIPAYLCRQTSILRAAAETKLPLHLKKGQFMSPWNMRNSVSKLNAFGATDILLTDRGTFFGYNMLINDFRSLPIMAETECKIGYDATHSIQMPTSLGSVSGGQREFIPYLVRAAAGCGIDCLFMEVHNDPPNAKSDPNTVLDLKHAEYVIEQAATMHVAQRSLMEKLGVINVK